MNNNTMENKEEKKDLKKWPYWVLTLLFLMFSVVCFKWGRTIHLFDNEYVADNEILGTFGDFFGGVLGTIFTFISVLLVVKTFRYQQTVTKDNQKQQETQRFNDVFFELLRLYQSEVKELNGMLERIVEIKKEEKEEEQEETYRVKKEQIQYNDKDFFDEEKTLIQKKYRNLNSYKDNIARSVNYYMLFYTKNHSKMAAYYRTLYRIYELIDKTTLIDEYQRKDYSKIVRAQLTESELFFLRYNAMTIYGKQFVFYINKYHILKHLPAFELLEFKDWWKNMSVLEREGVNMIFLSICKFLKDVFANGAVDQKYQIEIFPSESGGRFQLVLTLVNRCDFRIKLTINKSNTHFTNEFLGLYKMEDKKIQQLLDCFIKEIFLYSNFNYYNKMSEIETYSSPIIAKGSFVEIDSGIKNKKNNPLVIRYKPEN